MRRRLVESGRERAGGTAPWSAWRALALAAAMAAVPCIGVAAGWLLDRALGTSPLFVTLGLALGMPAGLAVAYRASKVGPRPGPRPPERAPLHLLQGSWALGGPDPAAAGSPPDRGRAGGQLRILVIEPDAELRADLGRRLHRAGFEVSAVGSGALALRVVEHDGPPDVALVDLALARMPPHLLVTALRSRARAHVPVAFLSRRPVTAGRYDGEPVLEEPFGTNRLLAVVDEALMDRRPTPPAPPAPRRWSPDGGRAPRGSGGPTTHPIC
jgi:CheY-like chemotaxis protein/F0F1-type ATP synthase assembly protein I